MNPYLPPNVYIPDGEPHIFGDRVYVYGSQDRAHGHVFCLEDYVCYSAPVSNLCDWRFEGVIWEKTADPLNRDGHMVLYAPDVACGPDGRFYLYYVLDKASVVSVAVCDSPAGRYEFYGYVKYADGTLLGEKPGDEPQFDPGLLVDGENIYLYTGIGIIGDKSRRGAIATVLERDMLTIKEPPVYIAPSGAYGAGTSFEGHEFFEASSMRKVGDKFYFVYSSVHMTELCYAVSDSPTSGFVYGGVIVSNCDLGISTYKPAEKRTYPYGNNHGSIIEIEGQWYVFYHRMTNDTWFSRQACIEPVCILPDGSIPQVEMTSQGARCAPFVARGRHPAYMACNLWSDADGAGTVKIGSSGSPSVPAKPAKITQEGAGDGDIDTNCAFISSITDGVTIGFKYFACEGIKKITITTRGYGRGSFLVRTSPDGDVLSEIPVVSANIWTKFSADAAIPDGTHALYFTYSGGGTPQMLAFELG
ncbi:MAG: family 43 glycosylhydrolase [Defluviitaleaceae bacterium]|nr:family 43 glycosylhydrolase [Defluviitaleaceae bacterium]